MRSEKGNANMLSILLILSGMDRAVSYTNGLGKGNGAQFVAAPPYVEPFKAARPQPHYFLGLAEDDQDWSLSLTITVIVCIVSLIIVCSVAAFELLPRKREEADSKTAQKSSNGTESVSAESSVKQVVKMTPLGRQAHDTQAVESMLPPKPVKFFADFFLRTEFNPDEHKKYHAGTYFQTGTLLPMKDAERSNVGKQAYQDFTNGLADISQREPVSSEHTGQGVTGQPKEALAKLARQAQWERLIQDRFATDCTWRFKERLRRRVHAYYQIKTGQAPMSAPSDFRNGIPIRRDTAKLLMASPESDNGIVDQAMTGLTLFLYLFGLFDITKSLLYLPKQDAIITTIFGYGLTRNGVAWLCFFLKELLFFALPAFSAVGQAISAAFSRATAPATTTAASSSSSAARAGPNMTVIKLRRLWFDGIEPAIAEQLRIVKTIIKSLSTVHRCIKLVEQLRQKECNASFKDYDNVLLNFGNVIFSVGVLLLADRGAGSIESKDVYSLLVSMALLLKNFAAQRLTMRKVYQSLKDVNENRLSKFELALLLTKMSEVVLTEDVQYNFVQHFYTGREDRLDPDVAPLEVETEEDIRRAVTENMPLLPEELAKEFGHDMLFEYAQYTGPAKPYMAR